MHNALKLLLITVGLLFIFTPTSTAADEQPPIEGVQVFDYRPDHDVHGRQDPADTRMAFPLPKIQLEMDDEMSPRQLSLGLKLLALLTVLTLAPSIMIMMTPFTRIVIVLSFTRRAIGTQSMPSDKMLVSLAIFLTLFQMAPIWNQVNENALEPFLANRIDYTEAFKLGVEPFRNYMRKATREEDLRVFVKLAQGAKPKNFDEVDTLTLIPAFIISEFKTGFQFGVVLFLPFLMLDMVIATTLMSMGMMMLPPAMVSTPFKILLFVLIDGWGLIINALMKSIVIV
ncbi:flagellar type III secretion system pore protein FliP [bacterium]|jgi:flagellar biosynthetic protein FliP|nr:flagellar type III secretion system pore protein FliP [bacterium]